MDYEAVGGLKLINCSEYSYTVNVTTAYETRETVYVKLKARQGELERIVIKKINVINLYDYNYQDTQNRVWLESELCLLDEAEEIISLYNQIRTQRYKLYLNNC